MTTEIEIHKLAEKWKATAAGLFQQQKKLLASTGASQASDTDVLDIFVRASVYQQCSDELARHIAASKRNLHPENESERNSYLGTIRQQFSTTGELSADDQLWLLSQFESISNDLARARTDVGVCRHHCDKLTENFNRRESALVRALLISKAAIARWHGKRPFSQWDQTSRDAWDAASEAINERR